MSLFKRQLAKCGKTITLQNRNIMPPLFGDTNFGEEFISDRDVQAIIKTVSGKVFFDGVGTEANITHEIRIEYVTDVTAETWILFKGRRIDILSVENCCEEDRILVLTCTERGIDEAAKS